MATLDSDDSTIETLDTDYEDIDSLHNLDVTVQYCTMWKTWVNIKIVRYRMYLKYTNIPFVSRQKKIYQI